MATQTNTFWQGIDPSTGQTASIRYTWDDVLLRVLSITVQNPTSKSIVWSLTGKSNNRTYNGTIPPNTASATVTLNNASAQNRLNITITPSGRLDGIEKSINFG